VCEGIPWRFRACGSGLVEALSSVWQFPLTVLLLSAGEICAFKIHGQELPFEAVVLNKTSGEGRLRAKSPIDCELQKEYTFIIQAYDCGAGPRETAWKKSHK
jgi:hypothetical protein